MQHACCTGRADQRAGSTSSTGSTGSTVEAAKGYVVVGRGSVIGWWRRGVGSLVVVVVAVASAGGCVWEDGCSVLAGF